MSGEFAFIEALRAIVTHPGARGLGDDAAVLPLGEDQLVLTMDTIVEGVHFLPDDPPETIAWKLMAVNVSDLSAKGASPLGCLTSYSLGEPDWDMRFVAGLGEASRHFGLPVLGGDTVRMPAGSARSFSLTALGKVAKNQVVPSRSGACAGDSVWISGTVGEAGLWLAQRLGQRNLPELAPELCDAYRRPCPHVLLGPALAPHVHAMMDVSDGVLVDASRMAAASGMAVSIDLAALPLSEAYLAATPDTRDERIIAATAGDDYVLLLACPASSDPAICKIAASLGVRLTRIGEVAEGNALTLNDEGVPVPLPVRLGYQH